jgi:hypothetical protein
LSPAPAGRPGRGASLRRDPYGLKSLEEGPQWEELAESRLALALTISHLHKSGATAGFSFAEAAQAVEVTIVGDRIPEITEQALRVAGCRVNRLAGYEQGLVVSFDAAGAAITSSAEARGAAILAAEAEAAAPVIQKSLGHYVLFGPPDQPATLANLLLTEDYLLAFDTCFGFKTGEAAFATMVTIVGDASAVSQQIEDNLREGGATVQRFSGTAGEVAATLANRIATGRPLV